MKSILSEMVPHKAPPRSDLDGCGRMRDRPLTLIECLLMIVLVLSPIILALGHSWWDEHFNPVTRRAIQEAENLRAANAELRRLIELDRSRLAAMREAK